MIKPKLAPNQKLVKDASHYYIETTTTITDTVWNHTQEITDRELFKPVYLIRRMKGRIWGAAQILKDPETTPTPYRMVLEYAKIEYKTHEKVFTEKRPVRFKMRYLFGNVSERVEY